MKFFWDSGDELIIMEESSNIFKNQKIFQTPPLFAWNDDTVSINSNMFKRVKLCKYTSGQMLLV